MQRIWTINFINSLLTTESLSVWQLCYMEIVERIRSIYPYPNVKLPWLHHHTLLSEHTEPLPQTWKPNSHAAALAERSSSSCVKVKVAAPLVWVHGGPCPSFQSALHWDWGHELNLTQASFCKTGRWDVYLSLSVVLCLSHSCHPLSFSPSSPIPSPWLPMSHGIMATHTTQSFCHRKTLAVAEENYLALVCILRQQFLWWKLIKQSCLWSVKTTTIIN